MGVFEDAIVKAKDIIDVTGQKVGEAIDIQKVKLQIARDKSEISKNYELLGRLYYSSVKKDNVEPEALSAVVDDIDICIDTLREHKAELAYAKGGIVCDECGAANEADSDYCRKCGKKL